MSYTRPLIEQMIDTCHRQFDYEIDEFTLGDLQSIANKFVEENTSKKCADAYDINNLIKLFTIPYHTMKVLLEVKFFTSNGIIFKPEDDTKMYYYFEVTNLFQDELEILSITGIIRKFRYSQTGKLKQDSKYSDFSAVWSQKYFCWVHQIDDFYMGIFLNPAMGYSML